MHSVEHRSQNHLIPPVCLHLFVKALDTCKHMSRRKNIRQNFCRCIIIKMFHVTHTHTHMQNAIQFSSSSHCTPSSHPYNILQLALNGRIGGFATPQHHGVTDQIVCKRWATSTSQSLWHHGRLQPFPSLGWGTWKWNTTKRCHSNEPTGDWNSLQVWFG